MTAPDATSGVLPADARLADSWPISPAFCDAPQFLEAPGLRLTAPTLLEAQSNWHSGKASFPGDMLKPSKVLPQDMIGSFPMCLKPVSISPSTEAHLSSPNEDRISVSSPSGSSHGEHEGAFALLPPAALDIDSQNPMKIHIPENFAAHVGPSSLVVATLDDTRHSARHVAAEDTHSAEFTTVMLRNIPNRCTRKILVERMDDGFRGTFDFIYMPIDFSKHCNMGYAFINFKKPETCKRFFAAFHGVKSNVCLLSCNSTKICEVTFARLQGLQENVYSLQNSFIMDQLADHKDWQPLLFDDQGDPVPFPKERIAMDQSLCGEGRGRRRRSRFEDADPPSHAMAHADIGAAAQYPCDIASYASPPAHGVSPWTGPVHGMPMPPSVHPGASPWSCWGAPQPEPALPTTAMLRNIPNNYTRDRLLGRLSQDFAGTFDFLYMPMDFNNHCNMGYAFINFRDPSSCYRFAATFHGVDTATCLPGFNSGKVCHVTSARVQGLDANVQRLRQSNVGEQLADHPEWQPLVFCDSGTPLAFLAAERMQRHDTTGALHDVVMEGNPHCVWPSAGFAQDTSVPTVAKVRTPGRRSKGGDVLHTTVMLRNIPNNYTRSMLLQKLSLKFRGAFDFLYLPMDFESCCNMGYAFINFRNVETCERFMNDFDGVECRVCLPGFNSAKVCRVTHARVQGLEGNIRHLRNSTIMRDLARHPDWQPLIFTENGDPLPLPKHLPQGQEAGGDVSSLPHTTATDMWSG